MVSKPFSEKIGILFIQLGSPHSPSTKDCRKFLREFLMDRHVIDIPFLFRWILVNLIIVPFRASKTSAAYQKVWKSPDGPLRTYSLEFEKAMTKVLGNDIPLALGMRYGQPSIEQAWKKLDARGVNRVFVIPLYPHYAASSFGTAVEAAEKVLKTAISKPKFSVIAPFYAADFFVKAWKAHTSSVDWSLYDFVLFSYHGIPERHIRKTDHTKSHCFTAIDCCAAPAPGNSLCYRHHCFETTRALVQAFQIPSEKTMTSFQSRLGRTPWIKPYTDLVLPELVARGIKRVAVLSPSFVVDGLETLEELEIRARADFIASGGVKLDLIHSLNADPKWVDLFAEEIKKQIAALP